MSKRAVQINKDIKEELLSKLASLDLNKLGLYRTKAINVFEKSMILLEYCESWCWQAKTR